VRKLFFDNAACPRRIFAERLPDMAEPWARRTIRLAERLTAIGLAGGIGRLMREADLVGKTRRHFKATTNSRHDRPIAPNHLDRQFTVPQPDQVYVGDITYLSTQKG
jgi:transposase InsO family protein